MGFLALCMCVSVSQSLTQYVRRIRTLTHIHTYAHSHQCLPSLSDSMCSIDTSICGRFAFSAIQPCFDLCCTCAHNSHTILTHERMYMLSKRLCVCVEFRFMYVLLPIIFIFSLVFSLLLSLSLRL